MMYEMSGSLPSSPGWDGDEHDVGLADPGWIGGGDDLVARCGVDPGDLVFIDIVADRLYVPRECIGKGVADIPEADNADNRIV